jgi:Transposase and inactivated derivatives
VQHREVPDDETIKEVTLKKEPTGEWFVCVTVDNKETPEKPENPNRCVGIDVGILNYAHDSDGRAVGSLNLSKERDRLQREQRKLSRKEHGPTNWEQQR